MGSATGPSGICPLCALGAHAPTQEVQDHLKTRAEAWSRIVPVSLGLVRPLRERIAPLGDGCVEVSA